MNNDPTLAGPAATESRFGLPKRVGAILAGGAFLVGSCSVFRGGEDEDVARLQLPATEIAGLCDNDPFAVSEYKEKVGTGPFSPIEAANEDNPSHEAIKAEAVEELGQGNAMGVALLQAQFNQQNSAYNPTTLLTEAQTIFNDIHDDSEKFSASCQIVSEALLTSGIGEVTTITADEVIELTNSYDADGNLDDNGLARIDDASTQAEIPVLGFKDANDAVLAGISLVDARNGHYVLVKTLGDQDTDVIVDDAPETTVVAPEADENGDPVDADATSADDDDQAPAGTDTDDDDAPTDDGTPTPSAPPVGGGGTPTPGEGDECDGKEPSPICEGDDPGGPGEEEPGPTTTIRVTTTTTPGGKTTTTIARPTTTTTPPTTTTPTTTTPTTTTPTTIPRPTTTTTEPYKPPFECDEVMDVCDDDMNQTSGLMLAGPIILSAAALARRRERNITGEETR